MVGAVEDFEEILGFFFLHFKQEVSIQKGLVGPFTPLIRMQPLWSEHL